MVRSQDGAPDAINPRVAHAAILPMPRTNGDPHAQEAMSSSDASTTMGVLNAFLRTFLADRDAGTPRSSEDYQALWPDHASLIAGEYRVLADSQNTGAVPSQSTWVDRHVRFGAYELVRSLASGGQGTVYLARDASGLHVALKVLSGLGVRSEEQCLRFRREAELASRLDHPGICAVRQFGEFEGVPFIAMDHIEGESFAALIARTRSGSPSAVKTDALARSNLRENVEIIRRVALALHAAHEAGIIHRDIKPQNIIIRTNSHPVIVDFGIARESGLPGATLTLTGEILGTPAYMSPEQIDPSGPPVDQRTDVFSLGVSLYEALTGERPFGAPTWEGILESIRNADPSDPRELNPWISKDLALVLMMALQKDRKNRYATANDLALDLERVQRGDHVSARPLGSWTRFRRWTRRNPWVARAVSAVLVMLVLATAFSWYRTHQAEAALADYRRLADAATLLELEAAADELWPPVPELSARYVSWIAKAEQLVVSLATHESELRALRHRGEVTRGSGEPGSMKARAIQEARETARFLTRRKALLGAEPPKGEEEASGRVRAALTDIDRVLSETTNMTIGSEHWGFSDPKDQARHDILWALVSDLRRFADGDRHIGLLADVRDRHRFARNVSEQTLERHVGAWERAIAAIGNRQTCPKYEGLKIRPQRGLIPLGLDPSSGLYEFMDLYTSNRALPDALPARNETGHVRATEDQGVVLVLIPGGPGFIGAARSAATAPAGAPIDPDPAQWGFHGPLPLNPYFIGKFELLRPQWRRLTGETPSQLRTEDLRADLHPVDSVTWIEADLWLRRAGLALPTTAQWEYAARGGTTTPWHTGADRGSLEGYANIAGLEFAEGKEPPVKHEAWNDHIEPPTVAGSFRANPFGLHDVHGNLSEWSSDGFGTSIWTPRPGDGKNVQVPAGNLLDRRSQHGGSYRRDAFVCKIAYQLIKASHTRDYESGLRAARNLDR